MGQAEARTLDLTSRSPMWVAEAQLKYLAIFRCFCRCIGREAAQLGLQPVIIWDVCVTGSSLTSSPTDNSFLQQLHSICLFQPSYCISLNFINSCPRAIYLLKYLLTVLSIFILTSGFIFFLQTTPVTRSSFKLAPQYYFSISLVPGTT